MYLREVMGVMIRVIDEIGGFLGFYMAVYGRQDTGTLLFTGVQEISLED